MLNTDIWHNKKQTKMTTLIDNKIYPNPATLFKNIYTYLAFFFICKGIYIKVTFYFALDFAANATDPD